MELLRKHPLPNNNRLFSYGTAGFRQKADSDLEAVVVRTGTSVVLQSMQHDGQGMGVMITASHNDESYNGVKIADPHGGMLSPEGERMAVYLANERDPHKVWEYISNQRRQLASSGDNACAPVVHVGRDTRTHSPKYRNLLVAMIIAMGGTVIDHGICTTPMLHHTVLHDNFISFLPSIIPCRPNIGGYLDLLAYSYVSLCATATESFRPTPTLVVDCACGVGHMALLALCAKLEALGMPASKIIAANAPTKGPLNEGCGSEYVQKEQKLPKWYDASPVSTQYCASLDGDADRVVFFAETQGEGNKRQLQLLDGDKIACLFCHFIQEQLMLLSPYIRNGGSETIRLGVVQTAYANGASTAVLKGLVGEANVIIAKTGVKHVHHAAHNFDIGVYFEANGHGTILFGSHFYNAVSNLQSQVKKDRAASIALRRLQLLPALVNQAVGDALSDLLLVDAILALQGRSLKNWHGMYQDLPSRQSKVLVPDRTVIKTNENETKCVRPPGMQDDLDTAMHTVNGRTFVRPSGTEDVVRVYAEGSTQDKANRLAKKAEDIVRRFTMQSKI
jgi:phosphoacetylglucosamine mutase